MLFLESILAMLETHFKDDHFSVSIRIGKKRCVIGLILSTLLFNVYPYNTLASLLSKD